MSRKCKLRSGRHFVNFSFCKGRRETKKRLLKILDLDFETEQPALNKQTAADYLVAILGGYVVEMVGDNILIVADLLYAYRVGDHPYGLGRRGGKRYFQARLRVLRRGGGETGQDTAAADINSSSQHTPRSILFTEKFRMKRTADDAFNRIDPEKFPHLIMADGFPHDHVQLLRIHQFADHGLDGNAWPAHIHIHYAGFLGIYRIDGERTGLEKKGEAGWGRLLVNAVHPVAFRGVFKGYEDPNRLGVGDAFNDVFFYCHGR